MNRICSSCYFRIHEYLCTLGIGLPVVWKFVLPSISLVGWYERWNVKKRGKTCHRLISYLTSFPLSCFHRNSWLKDMHLISIVWCATWCFCEKSILLIPLTQIKKMWFIAKTPMNSASFFLSLSYTSRPRLMVIGNGCVHLFPCWVLLHQHVLVHINKY